MHLPQTFHVLHKSLKRSRNTPQPEAKRLLIPCMGNANKFLRLLSFKVGLDWIVTSHDLRKFNMQLKMTRVNDPAFNERH